MLRLLILSSILLILAGCSARITPPATPETPRSIFILDHGKHSSLVLSQANGDLIRYSYGDWRYYAQAQTGLFSGFRAIALPSKAALGRRELPGPATAENVQQQVKVGIENMLSLEAEAEAVDRLLEQLQHKFDASRDSLLYRPEYDLEFVQHPVNYTFRHNSNRVLGDWLKELGSDIHGWPLLSDWKLQKNASK